MEKKYFLFFAFFCSAILWKGCEGVSFAQNKNIDSLRNLIKIDKLDTNKVNHLCKLMSEYELVNNFEKGVNSGVEALELAFKLDFKKGIVYTSSSLGNICIEQTNYPRALDFFFKALKISEEQKNIKEIANEFSNIGVVYYDQGSYAKALDYDFKALKMKEELGNKNGEANTLVNIGIIYDDQGNYAKALDYYFKAEKAFLEVGNKNHMGVVLGNIANTLTNQGKKDQALDYYFKALNIANELGNKNEIERDLSNIGGFYLEQKDYSKASDYNFKALNIAKEQGDKNEIARNLSNIGNVYTVTGKFKDAEQYLKMARNIEDSIGELNSLRQTEEQLYKLYDTIGRYKDALIQYRKSVALKDTLFSQENKKQLVQKEMNYEFEKKEAITQLKNEAESRKQKIIIWSVISGLLLVLISAIFIFRSLRITRKQKNIIEQQRNEVSKQKEIVDKQKNILEEHQKEIIDSINYAKRIQTALLTSDEYIKNNLPAEHFILFKPKDIVSGDFYWGLSIAPFPGWDMGTNKVKLQPDTKRQNTFYVATADCTGHGVPGAFMSMLNISYLNENVIERGIRLPHEILNAQRREIINALNPPGSTVVSKDGMDCILCVYDFDKMLLHFSAANNPLWLLRNGELTEYKADKMPVGKYDEKEVSFTLQTLELQKGDIIYTSTDGYADQFGGRGKKLMKKNFKEELVKIHHLSMSEQQKQLDHFFENWKGNNEQVDDVCVIGVKI